MRSLVILALLALGGCDRPNMTREEQMAAYKECAANGYGAVRIRNLRGTTAVDCLPDSALKDQGHAAE